MALRVESALELDHVALGRKMNIAGGLGIEAVARELERPLDHPDERLSKRLLPVQNERGMEAE